MTILLIILLILLAIYLYYRRTNAATANFPPKSSENKPWQVDLEHLQTQIDELKSKDHD